MRPSIERLVYGLYRVLPERFTHEVVRLVTPNFTLGVIPFVTRDDGHVLLVRQSYRPEMWGAPGGLCDRREHPSDATVREVREEVGIEVEIVGEPSVAVDAALHKVQYVTRCRPVTGVRWESAEPSSGEIVEVGWFDPTDMPELLTDVADAWAALGDAELWRRTPG